MRINNWRFYCRSLIYPSKFVSSSSFKPGRALSYFGCALSSKVSLCGRYWRLTSYSIVTMLNACILCLVRVVSLLRVRTSWCLASRWCSQWPGSWRKGKSNPRYRYRVVMNLFRYTVLSVYIECYSITYRVLQVAVIFPRFGTSQKPEDSLRTDLYAR